MLDFVYTGRGNSPVTVEAVEALREYLQEGDTVKAEIWIVESASVFGGQWKTLSVTIKKKYPHFAMTNKGVATWNNIAIRNKDLLRRVI